jgi:hypothetical protein
VVAEVRPEIVALPVLPLASEPPEVPVVKLAHAPLVVVSQTRYVIVVDGFVVATHDSVIELLVVPTTEGAEENVGAVAGVVAQCSTVFVSDTPATFFARTT